MLLPIALLAAAAPALADVRADYAEGLSKAVRDAVLADQGLDARGFDDIEAADSVDAGNAFFLGIGDPEGYHPYEVECPSDNITWVRPATDGISKEEKAYLERRNDIINEAVAKMLSASGLPSVTRTPVLGMALSGGGYRAMINGLGMTQALMNESSEASDAGTGGWFDAISYMAGLSGGSWATGSFIVNDAPLPTDLVANVWALEENLIYPSDGKVAFYTNMYQNVHEKKKLGFPTQITDYWSLALGEHLLPEAYRMANGANFTISQITRTLPKFQNASVPYPIIIAAERESNETIVAENATVWEFTPYEFGSWAVGFDNKTAGFFSPIEFMGTQLVEGKPNDTCYRGFDQLSFVMGTSSTLFNAAMAQVLEVNISSTLQNISSAILGEISQDLNDVSQVRNPSYKLQYNETVPNPLAEFPQLTLIDAGETNQNVPMEPLLIRGVDAILAFDNSADTTFSWPNGSALVTTYRRAVAFKERYGLDNMHIAAVPSTNTFVNKGLNTRPVFFGCNATDTPLIIYIPHYPWTAYSNSSTFQLAYEMDEATDQMLSSMRSLTLNGTVPTWPKCLACALTDRANGFTSENRSAECAECFDTWCWDGESDDSDPAEDYAPLAGVTPQFLIDKNLSSDVRTTSFDPKATTKDSAAQRSALSASALVAILAGSVIALL